MNLAGRSVRGWQPRAAPIVHRTARGYRVEAHGHIFDVWHDSAKYDRLASGRWYAQHKCNGSCHGGGDFQADTFREAKQRIWNWSKER